MKILYPLLLIILFLPLGTNALSISGKIVNANNEPIEDAFIFNLSNNKFTNTNELGIFMLDIFSESDTLEVSHMGYASRMIFLSQGLQALEIKLEATQIELKEVVIRPGLNTSSILAKVDLQSNPVRSSQEILRKIPGLVIGQHAGGGKAEQIFLRGFDIDHGTDINITVDGMPVNMVSHAHGQGYADLHFLIPETIQNINYGKGPYQADQGNFSTAGFVNFKTKKRLDHSVLQMEAGQFNTLRTLGMFQLLNSKKQAAYVAGELLKTDGPVESPQNFHRLNVMGKYNWQPDNQDQLTLTSSHFYSRWNASGQIPQRAVEAGLISRFGAIDDTEGGETSGTNLSLSYDKYLSESSFLKNNIYYTRYDFELYSNFTFFLNDPINADQIRQKENRNIFGFQSEWNKSQNLAEAEILWQVGVGMRHDQIDNNELSRSLKRSTTLEHIQLGDVDETNTYSYLSSRIEWDKWSIHPALRMDFFNFSYTDALNPETTFDAVQKVAISPKLNFSYQYSPRFQMYLKLGKSFHSNDSRVVMKQQGREILPAAYGADLGMIWKAAPRLFINSALWYLHLDQEFVYVGDEGIVEPGGKTRRLGIDAGLRYQLTDHLYLDGDINYAYARSIEEPKGENYIPLAPDMTATGGISADLPCGLSGGIRYRFLKTRPANEDNSIQAKGYFITDMNLNYNWKAFRIGFAIENLFNSDWNETQFATTSRLANESEPVEEIHFTPGTPFFVKALLSYRF